MINLNHGSLRLNEVNEEKKDWDSSTLVSVVAA